MCREYVLLRVNDLTVGHHNRIRILNIMDSMIQYIENESFYESYDIDLIISDEIYRFIGLINIPSHPYNDSDMLTNMIHRICDMDDTSLEYLEIFVRYGGFGNDMIRELSTHNVSSDIIQFFESNRLGG